MPIETTIFPGPYALGDSSEEEAGVHPCGWVMFHHQTWLI